MTKNTMQVVEVPKPGDAQVLQIGERPIPEPKSGEVLIKVAAAGLNRADVMQRNGHYPPPPGASDLLGLEVSGTIVKTAQDVDQFAAGDEVCALLAGGGYAQFCTAAATSCLRIPATLDLVSAASVPETFFTVWANVFMRGGLGSGETFLVHGGTSGIGTTAIQLARVAGASVCATAGSDEKCAACIEIGADRAINYRCSDFVEEVAQWTGNKGVNLILDIVGGSYLAKNIKCLTQEGRMVIIATQGGIKGELNMLAIMQKRLTVTGSTLRPRSIEQKAEIARQLHKHAWPALEKGTVKPIIDSVFPMDQVRQAHRRLESDGHIGKVILQIT